MDEHNMECPVIWIKQKLNTPEVIDALKDL